MIHIFFSAGMAVWSKWWLWLCTRAILDDACYFLTWSRFFYLKQINMLYRGNCTLHQVIVSWLEAMGSYMSKNMWDVTVNCRELIILFLFPLQIVQNRRKAEINTSCLCFSLSSYLYFLVTKKSLRLQVCLEWFFSTFFFWYSII